MCACGRDSSIPLRASSIAGCEELLPRQTSVGAVGGFEAGDGSGNGDRGRPDQERLGRRALAEPDVDRLHLPRSRAFEPEPGRGDEEVGETRRAVTRPMDEHEPAGGRARQEALADAAGEGRRHARVDGIPTLLEHPGACACREGMARGNHASHTRSLSAGCRGPDPFRGGAG